MNMGITISVIKSYVSIIISIPIEMDHWLGLSDILSPSYWRDYIVVKLPLRGRNLQSINCS